VRSLFVLFFLSLQTDLIALSCTDITVFKQAGVSKQALLDLKRYIDKNGSGSHVAAIADYSLPSTQKRFWILDLKKMTAKAYKVSHGSGRLGGVAYGDPEHDGMLDKCRISSERFIKFNARKNQKHSQQNMTRPGFFRSAELYRSASHPEKRKKGKLVKGWPNVKGHYNAMRMDGLSPGVNTLARAQGVVMHGAWYNSGRLMGRSFGCPAFTAKDAPEILRMLSKEQALFYSYVPQCKADYQRSLQNLPVQSCKG